jgi:hypothetical protein
MYNMYYRSCIYDMCRIEGDVEAGSVTLHLSLLLPDSFET